MQMFDIIIVLLQKQTKARQVGMLKLLYIVIILAQEMVYIISCGGVSKLILL